MEGSSYKVVIHTGDAWGQGKFPDLKFELFGSQGYVNSGQCTRKYKHSLPYGRWQAVQYALSKKAQRKGFDVSGQQDQHNTSTELPHATGGFQGPGIPKRDVFGTFLAWLHQQGGHRQLERMLAQSDASNDGKLDLQEVAQLLAKAVDNATPIELQMFVAMVDVDNDGSLSLAELQQSLADCNNIDTLVRGDKTSQPQSVEQMVAATIQDLRNKSADFDAHIAKLMDASTPGYITFPQIARALQAVLTSGSRDTLRLLLAHVGRTAHADSHAPGLTVSELKKCLGLQGAGVDGKAAAAVGWVPGRGRDIFALLRHHCKKNRAQLDALFPADQQLNLNQVRKLVRSLLESRAGEPPLTGRELRHLVAMLDANGNGLISRDEFETGLRDCREIVCSMIRFEANPSSLPDNEPAWPDASAPNWAQIKQALLSLHDALAANPQHVDALVTQLDSRGKGRLDQMEIQQLLRGIMPSLPVPVLRAVLCHLDLWDPSQHALLSLKHLMMALRLQPAPASLHPPPAGSPGQADELASHAGDEDTSGGRLPTMPSQLQHVADKLAAAARPKGLPTAEQWMQWHSNVKTGNRPSGRVRLGTVGAPLTSGFTKRQMSWHKAWLQQVADSRSMQAVSPDLHSSTGVIAPTIVPEESGDTTSVAVRPWPNLQAASLPYLHSAFGHHATYLPPSPELPTQSTMPSARQSFGGSMQNLIELTQRSHAPSVPMQQPGGVVTGDSAAAALPADHLRVAAQAHAAPLTSATVPLAGVIAGSAAAAHAMAANHQASAHAASPQLGPNIITTTAAIHNTPSGHPSTASLPAGGMLGSHPNRGAESFAPTPQPQTSSSIQPSSLLQQHAVTAGTSHGSQPGSLAAVMPAAGSLVQVPSTSMSAGQPAMLPTPSIPPQQAALQPIHPVANNPASSTQPPVNNTASNAQPPVDNTASHAQPPVSSQPEPGMQAIVQSPSGAGLDAFTSPPVSVPSLQVLQPSAPSAVLTVPSQAAASPAVTPQPGSPAVSMASASPLTVQAQSSAGQLPGANAASTASHLPQATLSSAMSQPGSPAASATTAHTPTQAAHVTAASLPAASAGVTPQPGSPAASATSASSRTVPAESSPAVLPVASTPAAVSQPPQQALLPSVSAPGSPASSTMSGLAPNQVVPVTSAVIQPPPEAATSPSLHVATIIPPNVPLQAQSPSPAPPPPPVPAAPPPPSPPPTNTPPPVPVQTTEPLSSAVPVSSTSNNSNSSMQPPGTPPPASLSATTVAFATVTYQSPAVSSSAGAASPSVMPGSPAATTTPMSAAAPLPLSTESLAAASSGNATSSKLSALKTATPAASQLPSSSAKNAEHVPHSSPAMTTVPATSVSTSAAALWDNTKQPDTHAATAQPHASVQPQLKSIGEVNLQTNSAQSHLPLKNSFSCPPLLVQCSTVECYITLPPGQHIGDVQLIRVSMRAASSSAEHRPCYLECIQVFSMTSHPKLLWEFHHRGWLQSNEQAELLPDALCWEEWDMRSQPSAARDTNTGHVTAYYNSNLKIWTWAKPPPVPYPSHPGAVPYVEAAALSAAASNEWLAAMPPSGLPRADVTYVCDLPLQPVRVRRHFGVGLRGSLFGDFSQAQVHISGELCPKAISMHAWGGYKALTAANNMGFKDAGIEAVAVVLDVRAAAVNAGLSGFAWFISHVGLDDSAGPLVAPVRFSVLCDSNCVWRSGWIGSTGKLEQCAIRVAGCSNLMLVVESEMSGGSRAVWVDPHLLHGRLLDADLSAGTTGQVMEKATLVRERNGEIAYLAPSTRPVGSTSQGPAASAAASQAHFQVAVFTSDVKNGGTKGQVYLRLKGKKGTAADSRPVTTKWQLLNKAPLERGSKCSCTLQLADMDSVEEVQLQHRPAAGLGSKDWHFQHIEVSREHTGQTRYFIGNDWFSSLVAKQAATSEPGSPSKLNVADAVVSFHPEASSNYYKVCFHVLSSGQGKGTGLDAEIQADWTGVVNGGYVFHKSLIPPGVVSCSHSCLLMLTPQDLGALVQLQLSTSQMGLLTSRLQCVEVVRMSDGHHFIFLPDPDPGFSGSTSTQPYLALKASTRAHFKIATFTGSQPEASTDARVYVDLFGETGQLRDLLLRDTGDTFNEGAEDVFFFPNPGLGELSSLVVSHDDSGNSPNWFLERTEVTDTGSGRTFVFTCQNWIGLDQGEDKVLERVLLPAHVLYEQAAFGHPIASYHLLLQLSDVTGLGWHAADAVELVGLDASGQLASTGNVLLGSNSSFFNLQMDNQYVKHVQAAKLSAQPASLGQQTFVVTIFKQQVHSVQSYFTPVAAQRQLSLVIHGDLGSSTSMPLDKASSISVNHGPYLDADQVDVFQVQCSGAVGTPVRLDVKMLQHSSPGWGVQLDHVSVRDLSSGVVVDFAAAGQWLGASPEMEDVGLSGCQSLRLLPAGLAAYTVRAKDVGQVQAIHVRHDAPGHWPGWAIDYIQLLQLPPEGAAGALQPPPALDPAAVAPPPVVPAATSQVPLGTQSAMTVSASRPLSAQALGQVAASMAGPQSVGHMAPVLQAITPQQQASAPAMASWQQPPAVLQSAAHAMQQAPSASMQSMPASAALTGTAPALQPVTQTVAATAVPPGSSAGPVAEATLPIRPPALYYFPGSQQPSGWPAGVLYVRHFLTSDLMAAGHSPSYFYKPPVISTASAAKMQQLMQDSQELLQLPDPMAVAVQRWSHSGKADALPVMRLAYPWPEPPPLEPSTAASLRTAFQRELAAYQAGESDVFAVLRACLRMDPALLHRLWVQCDLDRDGKLLPDEVRILLNEVFAAEGVSLSAVERAHMEIMMILEKPMALTPDQLLSSVKACRTAFKEACALQRMAQSDMGRPDLDSGLLGGAEMALCQLAARLVSVQGGQHAACVFAEYDQDGSGYLETGELLRALRQAEPGLTDHELRVLLSYLQHFGDTDTDGRVSLPELQASLLPFVPGPPAQEVQRIVAQYQSGSCSLLQSLHSVIKLQPALLPAVCMSRAAGMNISTAAVEVQAAGLNEPSQLLTASTSAAIAGTGSPPIPVSLLPAILVELMPGATIPPAQTSHLINLLVLDSKRTELTAEQMLDGIMSSADASKRALSMHRMVQEAYQEGVRIDLDPELGGAELILERLANVFVSTADQALAQTEFTKYDNDGSGYLDVVELCSVLRAVHAGITGAEMRLLLCYLHDFGDADADDRVSLKELKAVLAPFLPS